MNYPWPSGPPRMDENGEAARGTAGDAAIVNAGFHRTDCVSRRAFLVGGGGLGLVAACGRLPRPAAPPPKLARIGVLSPGADASRDIFEAFRQGLRDLGYREGRTSPWSIVWRPVGSSGCPAWRRSSWRYRSMS
jgi:hypothetical protein